MAKSRWSITLNSLGITARQHKHCVTPLKVTEQHSLLGNGALASLSKLSEQAVMLYRILPALPDLVPGRDERPPLLRPAWQIRGGARPWSRGAAVPRPVRRRPGVHGERHATPRPGRQRRTHRGTRAGHRVQRRRHRTLRHPTCSVVRPPHRDGTLLPPDRHLGPPVSVPAADPPRPETRCLLRPPRLSAGQRPTSYRSRCVRPADTTQSATLTRGHWHPGSTRSAMATGQRAT